MKKLSIVIPVYYNQDSLFPLFNELTVLEQSMNERGIALELIFVNDGSRDESLARLKDIKRRRPETVVLNHLANRGSMTAIKTGLSRVTGDCFTYLAADLQDPPALLLEMVDHWKQGERFVVRTRASRSDPFFTRLLAWINYKMVRFLVFSDYPPGGYDMAVFDRIFLTPMLECGRNKNLAMFAWSLGVPAKTLTYHREEREHGKSMWTLHKKLNYFIDSTVGFSVKPMRLISMTGFLLAMVCFSYSAFVIIGRLVGWIDTPGFATLASIIGFLQGCGFVISGILGEYIWRIYTEINKAPSALVEEVGQE